MSEKRPVAIIDMTDETQPIFFNSWWVTTSDDGNFFWRGVDGDEFFGDVDDMIEYIRVDAEEIYSDVVRSARDVDRIVINLDEVDTIRNILGAFEI